MKKFLALLIMFAILIAELYCKKSNSSGNNNNNNTIKDTTSPSAIGVPTGPSVSKFISVSGGSIFTADGRVELDIPNGALPNGDTITIQNITNSAMTSTGDAYRFLPNGLKFANPVTIKFHYTDDEINGSLPELLGIAYQDSAGFWIGMHSPIIDTVSKIISAQTSHFTDYIDFKSIVIFPMAGSLIEPSNKLLVNKKETFKVIGTSVSNVGRGIDFPRINDYFTDPQTTFDWNVNGTKNGNSTYGTTINATTSSSGVTTSPGQPSIESIVACTYTAPTNVPKNNNPVTLSVSILVDVRFSGLWVEESYPTYKNLTFKIKIIDGPVYRIDVVDWEDLGSGGTVNYYDSASVWIKILPDAGATTATNNISQDSIRNFPPVAWPTTATVGAGNCTYLWIPEPIGTVNITSGSVYYGPYGTDKNSFFVNATLNSTNANTAWATITCPNASATVNKASKPNVMIPVPFIVDITQDPYSVLLTGTEDQDHIRVSLDTLGPGH